MLYGPRQDRKTKKLSKSWPNGRLLRARRRCEIGVLAMGGERMREQGLGERKTGEGPLFS